MRFDLITIFPEFFAGPLEHGIVRKARESSLIEINIQDLRVFTKDKHRTVDDRPFGGGEGMILKPEPIFDCVEFLGIASKEQRIAQAGMSVPHETVILLTPSGQRFDQGVATELAQIARVTII